MSETIKNEVSSLLKKLPDNCSLEDIQYHLYVLQKVELGMKDLRENRIQSHEKVEELMKKWIDK